MMPWAHWDIWELKGILQQYGQEVTVKDLEKMGYGKDNIISVISTGNKTFVEEYIEGLSESGTKLYNQLRHPFNRWFGIIEFQKAYKKYKGQKEEVWDQKV